MMDDSFTSDNITINLQIELPKKCHVQQSYYYFMVKKNHVQINNLFYGIRYAGRQLFDKSK